MTKRQTTTRDIGFAIHDFCEGYAISHFGKNRNDDGCTEYTGFDTIAEVDISDPDNPIFHMESGAVFTVRIVRTG
jgi:hypothetical protein